MKYSQIIVSLAILLVLEVGAIRLQEECCPTCNCKKSCSAKPKAESFTDSKSGIMATAAAIENLEKKQE